MRGSNVAQTEAQMAVDPGPSAFAGQALSMFDDLLAGVSHKSDVCELFRHLSAAACRIIPYDEAQLVLLTEAGSLLRYARTLDGPSQVSEVTSPATILDDHKPQVLDVVPESDRGMRCGVKVPVQIENRVVGAFSLLSRSPHAYSARDLLHAQQLANCLGHGLAYQRLSDQVREAGSDRQRSAEIESSAELLRTISGVLDIRTVFPRISEIAKKMLPHDALAMVFVDQDRHFVRQAHAPDDFPDPPLVTHKTPLPRELIIADITTALLPVFEPADAFAPVIAAGYHSFMGVMLPARQQVIELSFWSKGVGAFEQRHLPLARRIADYVALSVSHEQLVEAGRQAAEAQAHAPVQEPSAAFETDLLRLSSRAGDVGNGVAQIDLQLTFLPCGDRV